MLNLTFHDLQFEVSGWAGRNFPDAVSWQPLMGCGEELGELYHAHLKESQGIRGNAEELQGKAKDAIGDIVVYLAHYCALRGFDLQEVIEDTWNQVKKRDWQHDPVAGNGKQG